MICKNCNQPIEKNTVRSSPAPFVYHPYKHSGAHLIGCFDKKGNPLGTKAEKRSD